MFKELFSLKFVVVFFVAIVLVSVSFSQELKTDKVHLGIVYPLSTHGKDAPAYTNNFSLHLIAGVSANEEGFSFAGFSNVVKQNVKGVHFAGFSYHVANKTEGLLFSGFANTYKEAKGMQFAGFTNFAKKNVEGAQFAGFLNKAQHVKGLQFAGFANIADSLVKGPQLAGFLNKTGDMNGLQFAGFGNMVADSIEGSQFAGFINLAKDIKGSQFAGFINIARKVNGVQIAGFINIADSSDYPIGVINIIKKGEKSIGLSIDEQQTSLVSFRSGGKTLYGIIGLGYNLKNTDEVYAMEIGMGAHFFNNGSKFRLNTEFTTVCLESFKKGEYFKNTVSVLPAFRIAKNIELFAGASLNYLNTNTQEGRNLTKKYIHSWNGEGNNNFQGIYAGYKGGINFVF